MRRLDSILGMFAAGVALLAGCSESRGTADAGPADAAGVDGGDARDAPDEAGVEAGGLGASLSWYCPAPGTSCPAGVVTDYNRCLLDRCGSEMDQCPCAGWLECTTHCACSDLACRSACVPTFDCLVCGQAVARCVGESGCERPACFQPPTPDAGPDTNSVMVIVGPPRFPDAAPPAADGGDAAGPVTDGGLRGTCADLRTCCQALSTPAARDTCLSQVMLLGTDPLCAAALLVYRSSNMCP
jgi:hypothetical protein